MNITEVHERIFISDGKTAESRTAIARYGITAIVSAATEFSGYRHSVPVVKAGLHDEHPGQSVNSDDQLRHAVNQFVRLYNEGHTVLSHCRAGHNRSGAIVVGAMVSLGIYPSVFEAYGRIASRRELHIQPLLLQHLARMY